MSAQTQTMEVPVLPPAPLYPARIRLSKVLDAYQQAVADADDYRLKAGRAEAAGKEAVANRELTEEEAAVAVARAGVLEARLRTRESERDRCYAELERAIGAAVQELNALVTDTWLSWRSVIGERGCQAMQLPVALLNQGLLDEALSFSKLLQEIRAFEVPAYAPGYTRTYVEDLGPALIENKITDDGKMVENKIYPQAQKREVLSADADHPVRIAKRILENFEKLILARKKAI